VTSPGGTGDDVPAYRAFYRGRRVLVTGGLGFIGSNLARQLVELGADTLVVDALLPDYGGNPFNIAGIETSVAVNYADVRDERVMEVLVRGGGGGGEGGGATS
jgi:UDP-glucose 4-epimerase